jgi:hypothetical protein
MLGKWTQSQIVNGTTFDHVYFTRMWDYSCTDVAWHYLAPQKCALHACTLTMWGHMRSVGTCAPAQQQPLCGHVECDWLRWRHGCKQAWLHCTAEAEVSASTVSNLFECEVLLKKDLNIQGDICLIQASAIFILSILVSVKTMIIRRQ